jgi:cysteine-rich repeat protein
MRSMKLAAVCMLVAVGCSRPAAPVATGSVQSALTSTTCTNTTLPSWPTSWATMLCHGTPASDPVGDASPAIIDAVGTSSFPAVESAIDANFLYLRIRSNLSVGSSACTCTSCTNDKINDAHGWGFDFDTDGNPTTYEFQILMNGASNQSGRTLEFNQNLLQSGAVDNPSEKAETPACIYAGADADARVRVDKASDGSLLGGDCDYFISAAFPLSELAQRGYDMKAARLVWAGSSAQAQNLSGDIVCDNQGSPKLSTSEGDPMSMCFGGCCTSDADCTAGHPTTFTTLSAALTATATTASVVSTTGYPTSGVLLVDSENIAYSGVTATSFTGLTRGALGTTAAAHASGATASDYFGNKFCNTSTGTCGCSISPDSCPSGEFCDPNTKSCRKDCTSAAPQGGSCSTTGDMTLCCDDGNSCTTNACVSGKCVYTATGNGSKCEDYNSCTGAGATETATCSNGVCGALVVGCTDDGLGCTSDVCESYDGTCVHPLKSAGTVCRAASGSCDVAETCNGTSTACPADAKQPDNSPCSDGNACTSGETCKAGVCGSPTSTVSCNNPPACKSSVGASCDPSTGACSYPTSIVGQSCASGAGGGCNCGTAVCDTTGNASPGICETANTCGNGLVEAGEGCDDGNSVAGDGCDASCKIEDGRACSANSAGVTGDASCASGVCDAVGNAAPG